MNKKQAQVPLFISQENAEIVLQSHKPKLRQVVLDAWGEWERIPDEQRSKLDARARANCLYRFMVHYANVYFPESDETKPFESRGLFLVGIANQVTVRFKKLGRGKKTCNILTDQQIKFGLQLDLPGIPKAARLTVGYILDITQTRIKDVLVTFHYGRKLTWSFSLLDEVSSVIQMPLPASGNQTPRKARVKAKIKKEQIEE